MSSRRHPDVDSALCTVNLDTDDEREPIVAAVFLDVRVLVVIAHESSLKIASREPIYLVADSAQRPTARCLAHLQRCSTDTLLDEKNSDKSRLHFCSTSSYNVSVLFVALSNIAIMNFDLSEP